VNGLTAAKGLRRSIEDAGGVMRISVPALGDAFGRGKLTTRARTGIEQVLARAGVEVAPGLNDPSGDGWVTLRIAQEAPGGGPLPAPSAPRGASGPRLVEVGPRRQLRPAPFLAALAFLVPVLLVIALASPDANRPGRAAAETEQTTPSRPDTLLDKANSALLAGDYTAAVRFTRQADPTRVPALRQRIAAALTTQARAAQRRRAYVRAIKLSRRAARYGRAPGASAIVRQSRAGLDLRREEQRRAERRQAAAEGDEPSTTPATTDAG
jgi:hypothetical protein